MLVWLESNGWYHLPMVILGCSVKTLTILPNTEALLWMAMFQDSCSWFFEDRLILCVPSEPWSHHHLTPTALVAATGGSFVTLPAHPQSTHYSLFLTALTHGRVLPDRTPMLSWRYSLLHGTWGLLGTFLVLIGNTFGKLTRRGGNGKIWIKETWVDNSLFQLLGPIKLNISFEDVWYSTKVPL